MMMFDTLRALDAFDDAFFSAFDGGRAIAPVNLHRENDRYVLEADLPGYDPKSIDVSVDGQSLTIRAHRSTESETEKAQWLVRERGSESMVRQFPVSQDVDADAISATFRDGVLHVELPIRDDARPRKVQVAVGASPAQTAIGSATAEQQGHQGQEQEQEQEQPSEGKAPPAHSVAH